MLITGLTKFNQLTNKLTVIHRSACWPSSGQSHSATVPAGSPSRGGDVAVYVFDINQPSLPAPFYSILVSISVFMALSTVFHSINNPDDSPLSHSVLPILFLPHNWSFQLLISRKNLLRPLYNPLWLTGLKFQLTNQLPSQCSLMSWCLQAWWTIPTCTDAGHLRVILSQWWCLQTCLV